MKNMNWLLLIVALLSFNCINAQSYIGTWKNSKTEFELKKDGTTVLTGFPAKYTYENGIMAFDFGGGIVLKYKVTVTGNTMTSVGNGQSEVYQRVAGKTSTTSAGTSIPKSNGMELCGEWCKWSNSSTNYSYSSHSCFNLVNDGTYTYYSGSSTSGAYGSTAGEGGDSGTWSFDGSTIHFYSNSQGALQYNCIKTRKGNDAALNIDGVVYIASQQHYGW